MDKTSTSRTVTTVEVDEFEHVVLLNGKRIGTVIRFTGGWSGRLTGGPKIVALMPTVAAAAQWTADMHADWIAARTAAIKQMRKK